MHPAHIAVTLFMAICGLGAALSIWGPFPGLTGLSFFFGWWATVGAMVISLVLAGVLAVRATTKSAAGFLKHSWLGLANGAVAFSFWALLLITDALHRRVS